MMENGELLRTALSVSSKVTPLALRNRIVSIGLGVIWMSPGLGDDIVICILNMLGTAPVGASAVQVGSQHTCLATNCTSWPGFTAPSESAPPAATSARVSTIPRGSPGSLNMTPRYPL